MKKLFPVLLLIPVTVCGLLSGCGGGSGKSGDDGNTSLSGQQVSLFEGGSILFQLQFSGQDVDVIRMDTRAVYDGVYTYRFNSGENAGVLNIAPAANSSSACTMANVNIAFDDAGRNAGVITSGTITETGLDFHGRLDMPRTPELIFRASAVQDKGEVPAERIVRNLDQFHTVKAGDGRSFGFVIRLTVINGFYAMGTQRLHA